MSAPVLHMDIPIDEYHAHPCYSHSKLRVFARGGPRLYYMTFINPSLPPRKRTDAMVFGDFFETYVQRPSAFPKACLVAPAGKGNETGPKRDFLKSIPKGTDYIDQEDLAKMANMKSAMDEHDLAMALISGGQAQVTMRNNIRGALCQARPDWLCMGGIPENDWEPYSLDLKTTDSLDDFESDIYNYGYYSQAAMVEMIADVPMENYILAVEKQIPHRVALYMVCHDSMAAGREWVSEQLYGVTSCVSSNSFPRIEQGVKVVRLPAWMKRKG